MGLQELNTFHHRQLFITEKSLLISLSYNKLIKTSNFEFLK